MKKFGLIAIVLVLLGVLSFVIWQLRRPGPTPGPDPTPTPGPTPSPNPKPLPPDSTFEDANRAASRPSVNLLRLPQARRVRTTALPGEADGLAALTDDKPGTVAEATASADGPLEVVYSFDGGTVTAEALFVRLPPGRAGAATGRVEVLVSNLSPDAGFRMVRSDPLARTTSGQVFPFPAIGARWILLRFYPAGGEPRVAVAEVAVHGQNGPPASRYAFKEASARAVDVLARLEKLTGLNVKLSDDERKLFADAQGGKFKQWTFAAAALLASGVDAGQHKKYLARLEALESEALKAVGSGTSWEKGEKLLRWLHEGPLSKGYLSKQTDLSVLLSRQDVQLRLVGGPVQRALRGGWGWTLGRSRCPTMLSPSSTTIPNTPMSRRPRPRASTRPAMRSRSSRSGPGSFTSPTATATGAARSARSAWRPSSTTITRCCSPTSGAGTSRWGSSSAP